MKRILPFLHGLVIATSLFASSEPLFKTPGLPLVRNYLPRDYKSHNQNWATLLDKRGVLYTGNSSGLLEFDGLNWKLTPAKNEVVFSLAMDSTGLIYAGSVHDYGCFRHNDQGELVYTSLLDSLKVGAQPGLVWSTHYIEDKVFFITRQNVIAVTGAGDGNRKPASEVWSSEGGYWLSYVVSGNLYVQDLQAGILRYHEGSFRPLPGTTFFNSMRVMAINTYGDAGALLVSTQLHGHFIYQDGKVTPLASEEQRIFPKFRLGKKVLAFPGGLYALATYDYGLVFIDATGRVVAHHDLEDGLADNNIQDICWARGKLWIATLNGISIIDYPNPFSLFNTVNGLLGSLTDIAANRGFVYTTSSRGVSVLTRKVDAGRPAFFTELKETTGDAWRILPYEDGVLAASVNGLYRVRGAASEKIPADMTRTYDLLPSERFKGRIYVALDDGIGMIEERGGKFFNLGRIPGYRHPVRNLAENRTGELLVGTVLEGIVKITGLEPDGSQPPRVESVWRPSARNLTARIFPVGRYYLCSLPDQSIFLDENGEIRTPPGFEELAGMLATVQVMDVTADGAGNLWIAIITRDEIVRLLFARHEPEGFQVMEIAGLTEAVDCTNINVINALHYDREEELLWLVGSDGAVSLDPRFLQAHHDIKPEARCLIRRVTLAGDSLLYAGDDALAARYPSHRERFQNLPWRGNSMSFRYAAMSYSKNPDQYQYMLEGYETRWSEWSEENSRTYTNLPGGQYRFRVRAREDNGPPGPETTFTFSIATPWYYAWYMMILYAGLIGLVWFGADRLRFKYMNEQQRRLERTIQERTSQIAEQAEALEKANAAKDTLFSIIAHDLRGPVGSLSQGLELLAESDKQSEEFRRKVFYELLKSAKTTYLLLDNLLKWARSQTGNITLVPASHPAVGLIQGVVNELQPLASRKGITILTRADGGLKVMADQETISIVLRNLISNAIKFTPDGGTITVSAAQAGDSVEMAIRDTGVGIKAESLATLFNVGFTTYGTNREKGSGLGLPLCKDFIERNGGTLQVESVEGEGSRFWFTLPQG